MATRRTVAAWNALAPKTRGRWNKSAGGSYADRRNGPGRAHYLSGASMTPAQRGHAITPRVPITPAQALRSHGRGTRKTSATRERAHRALSLGRRKGLPLNKTAQWAGTTPDAVLRHTGSAWEKTSSGRWRARAADDLVRVMPLISGGVVYPEVAITGSHDASIVGRYWNAVDGFLRNALAADIMLAEFTGVTVDGVLPDGTEVTFELETDPEVLEAMERDGELDDLVVPS
jgi:hypothetical protein